VIAAGHRRHELHAHAHEHEASADEQHPEVRGEAGGKGGERIDEDAPGEHAAAAEPVGEVAAEEAEQAAAQGRHVEQQAHPAEKPRAAGLEAAQFQERGPRDQRQHQQFVDVECEADRGDRADEPAGEREPPCHGGAGRRRVTRGGGHASSPGGTGRRRNDTCRSGPEAYRHAIAAET
jgi:hypothetical protein